jgi:ubiquinone/menaquinone biosynthesis C-methylase UbiE
MAGKGTYTYDPGVFEAPDLARAKHVILTPEPGQATDERWARETPYLAQLLGEGLALKAGQLVIDYGCGIGRMAKALIERYDVQILGVDISQQMRSLAPAYVGSPAFSVVSRGVLERMAASGLRADAAISVWVLQHCAHPAEDLALLRSALAPGARLGVVNTFTRIVPTREGPFINDDLDMKALLADRFAGLAEGGLDPAVVGDYIAERSYWSMHTALPAGGQT